MEYPRATRPDHSYKEAILPTFPISKCGHPKNAPFLTMLIVFALSNAVNHLIASTGVPVDVARSYPSLAHATPNTVWLPSHSPRHAPHPWYPLITSDCLKDIRYPGAGWSPAIRSNTCRNTSRGTATSAI